MENICKLAQEKGFTPKTVSTGVTFRYYTENGKNILINNMCKYLLLCEIQAWASITRNLEIVSHKYKTKQLSNLPITFKYKTDKGYSENYSSYREALEAGLKEILDEKSIQNL